MATQTAARPRTLKIVDADTHFTEPHNLWIDRAGGNLRDRVPQVKKREDGSVAWMIDGNISIGDNAPVFATIRKDGSKARGLEYANLTITDIHEGCFSMEPRLKFMDEIGVYAQIVYPNILGFGGHKTAQVDKHLRLAVVQIFNDYMADLQEKSKGRLNPMALLPWWDINEAVKEVERTAKLGMHGININSDPQSARFSDGSEPLPDLGAEYWNPLWEVCQDKDIPINFHIGGSEQSMNFIGTTGWHSLPQKYRGALGGASQFFDNGRVLANLIYTGLLDRYEKLQFVSVESGIGWIPFMLEVLNYQYREITDAKRLKLLPSEYFAKNFYGCFWFEREDIAHTIRQVGVDRVMFETDFPHPTCLYPVDDLENALPGLTREELTKVMSTNAANLYKIKL